MPSVPSVTITLSVVVPFHDVAAYAPTTLDSLRRNAGPGVEFLLIDDCSADGTSQILHDHADRIPGARVITSAENVNVAAARNLGLAQARGRYVTFLDGDDFVAPGYYAELVTVIERLGCDLVRTDHVRVEGRQRTVHRIAFGPRGQVRPLLEGILPTHRVTAVDAPNVWAGIYHRRLLDAGLLQFSEHLRTCEDRAWIWRLHLKAASFAVVGLTGVRYRRDVAGSLTRITDERQLDFLPAFDQVLADVAEHPRSASLLPKAVRSYCSLICHHHKQSAGYPDRLRADLRQRSRQALRAMPADVLPAVLTGLDPERRTLLESLRGAA